MACYNAYLTWIVSYPIYIHVYIYIYITAHLVSPLVVSRASLPQHDVAVAHRPSLWTERWRPGNEKPGNLHHGVNTGNLQ